MVCQPGWVFALGAAAGRHLRREVYRQKRTSGADTAAIVSSSSWLLVATILVPALLFLLVAWHDRAIVFHDTKQVVFRTVAIFEQHARNVFQTHALIAAQINERIRGTSEIVSGDGQRLI